MTLSEVGARLVLQGRQQFSNEARQTAADVASVGRAAETSGAQATSLGKKIDAAGATAKRSWGIFGRRSGTTFGTQVTEGATTASRRMPSHISNAIGRGMVAAGSGAGRRFGSSMHETAMEYVKTIGASMLGFFAAEKVKETLTESVKLANEATRAQHGTAAALKSTHDASGMTVEGIHSLAEELSNVSAQSPIATQGMENLLLTFPQIKAGGDIFKGAAEEAQNLSARLGTSLPTAARMMGRALNDPTKGMTALSRVGIRFSDQQTAVISKLVSTGHIAKAQALILEEIHKRVGGAAAAAVTPTDRLKLAWEKFQESLGQHILPILNHLTVWLTNKGIPDLMKFGGWVSRNSHTIKILGLTVLAIIGIWKIYRGVMLISAAATALMEGDMVALDAAMDANPIMLVVIGIAALAAGLIYAYKHCTVFRNIVNGAFHVIGAAIDFVKKHWKAFATVFAALIGGPILGAIVLIVTHFHTFQDIVKSVVSHVVGFFKGLPGHLLNIGIDIANAITSPFRGAFNAIADLWNNTVGRMHFTVPSWVPHFGGHGWGFPQIPHWDPIAQRANGGRVSPGIPYLVGERGPEPFIPDVAGTVVPNHRAGAVMRSVVGKPATVPTQPRGGNSTRPILVQVVLDRKVVAEATHQADLDEMARQ